MVRKGIRRAHTGCGTCKTRRIKCDETHPHCFKCTSTGRKCDGYTPWIPRTLQRVQPSLIPGAGAIDLRSLDFFRRIVAPVLAGPLPRSFWTHVVPQVTHQEPALRHAAVAMSSLYEQFRHDSHADTPERRFALQHYSTAVQQIVASRVGNLDSVVMTCVLFISVEFLRGNPKAGLVHYQHGRRILASYDAPEHLLGIFRQLSVFMPFFSDFETLPSNGAEPAPAGGPFRDLTQAQEALDWLIYRAMKMGFAIDQTLSNLACDVQTKEAVLQTQRTLDRHLDAWSLAVSAIKPGDPSSDPMAVYLALEARWLVCKVWTNRELELDQPATQESHEEKFQRMVEIASEVIGLDSAPSAKSVFKMGFPPVLHFIIMNSENLELRLDALALFRSKCCSKENLWDFEFVYLAAKRTIEEDHGIVLDTNWIEEVDPGQPRTNEHDNLGISH